MAFANKKQNIKYKNYLHVLSAVDCRPNPQKYYSIKYLLKPLFNCQKIFKMLLKYINFVICDMSS